MKIIQEITSRKLGCSYGLMVKALAGGLTVREFELELRNYIHFWTNSFGKGMNPLILPAMC